MCVMTGHDVSHDERCSNVSHDMSHDVSHDERCSNVSHDVSHDRS